MAKGQEEPQRYPCDREKTRKRHSPHLSKLGSFCLRQLVRQPTQEVPGCPSHPQGWLFLELPQHPAWHALSAHAFLLVPRTGISSLNSSSPSLAVSQLHTTLPRPFYTPGNKARRSRGSVRTACTVPPRKTMGATDHQIASPRCCFPPRPSRAGTGLFHTVSSC